MTMMEIQKQHREMLHTCERAQARIKSLIANGQQELNPEMAQALRELDKEIKQSRAALGCNRRG